MRFQAAGQYTEGAADVDPIAAPLTILSEHFFNPKGIDRKVTEKPEALYLALLGTGAETVTLTLYSLIEDLPIGASADDYKKATTRWFQFATGIVVTNGTLQKVTTALPAGGIIYGRMTAETLTASATRSLLMAWVAATQ